MRVDSRRLGLFLEEVQSKIDQDRNNMIKYVDRMGSEINKMQEYIEYLTEHLDKALVEIEKLKKDNGRN